MVFPMVKAAATVPMPSGNMSQAEESHTGGKKKAGYVKGDLDFWVRAFDDPGEVSWKQVSWDDREFAAVGKGNAETQNQIT